ncbi:MAG TPA: hypothetical protein VEY09_17050 [Pyrinomonadaceae bacterium]|nr:hypothetical protein [Pyrinomonadaceae bacterium]
MMVLTEMDRRLKAFVDRADEMSRFCQMLEGGERPIMAVWGGGGLGKSSLMARMIHECSLRKVRKAEVLWTDTRRYDYLAVMRKMRDDIGADRFGTFTKLVNYYFDPKFEVTVKVEGSVSVGANMVLNNATVGDISGVVFKDSMIVVPRPDLNVTEMERMIRLTDEFLQNLAGVTEGEPLVVFFDAVEKMTDDTRKWVWGELLNAVMEGRLQNIRFVLCGRERPAVDRLMESFIEQSELRPLGYEDIVAYLERRDIPEGQRELVAEVVYANTGGKPDEVAYNVESLLQLRRTRKQ